MGNSCAGGNDPCAASQLREPKCRNQECRNNVPLIDEESEEDYSECIYTYLLKQKESIASQNGGFESKSATTNLVDPRFSPGLPFNASNTLEMLKPSLVGLLNQKAASCTRTHDNGRSQQTDVSALKKPSAQLELYIVTWNMNGRLQEPEKNLSLLLDLDGEKRDLYVIGLQEAPKFCGEETIGKLLGEMYCCVGLSLMLSLQLYIFAKKSLRQYITGTLVDKVGVGGLGYVVGRQKGAAAVLLAYNKVSLLFITSHLAPHECNLMERNHQYERICKSVFTKSDGLCSMCKDLRSVKNVLEPQFKVRHVHNFVEESDVVIWLGDLNYRLEMPRASVGFLISHNLEEVLWNSDQLHRACDQGEVFTGFSEGLLLFPPTYKFDVGTDNYDSSAKERTPAWTDRILYKVKPSSLVKANLVLYNSIGAVKTSDHKPVKAILTLTNLLRTSSCAF
ncbi:hypothetical protein M758_7G041400 [Ceratodon purpureus]|nr:hypothetical protein M758_7G041400 [Ceratodon purpureus]